MSEDYLLIVEGLKKYFPVNGGFLNRKSVLVKAVDGVDLKVKKGETYGLVGESGCGKTTLGRCILRLDEPTEGRVFFDGHDILAYDRRAMRELRRHMQIIFQDPYSSLDPRKTVGQIIGEAFRVHKILSKEERRARLDELMGVVGLRPEQIQGYPHEFSGGQRQRICVARALALNPKLVIADEPVSALDVSIQAQILNLLVELQHRYALTYIFISHDLSVVRHICDRVAVMYLGRIVELGDQQQLYSRPLHPYTKALLSAVPVANPLKKKEAVRLEGDVPSPINPPSGCTFHPRCECRKEVCVREAPSMEEIERRHWAACHFPKS